ncbi:MAG: DUF4912 domain-containing protein [Pyrinomonadaceae bacterium]|nr:DUF4912 domain-containing protein [Pyrinomonadaceae bacterium]
MLHFLTGSSERALSSAPSTQAPRSETIAANSFDVLAADEPLPEIQRGDYARLLVQSPQRLYLYWSFARDPFTILRRMANEAAGNYTLALRLVDVVSNAETLQLTSRQATSAWLDAQAGRRYRVDLGFFAVNRPFIRILSSNVAHAPRAGVSPQVDATTEFHVSPSDFTRTLSESGYVNDAIEVWLEAADAATGERATRAIAERFSGAEVSSDDVEELSHLRHLIASLAAGISLERLRGTLSPPLARWLEQAQTRGEAIDSARLLDVLRSVLDFELEYELFDESAAQRFTTPMWGGSDVRFPTKLFHVWLPSMSAGAALRLAALDNG